MNDALRKLYQEVIVEHHKSPHNHGPLEGATHAATAHNPLCGDQVTLRLIVGDDQLTTVRFESRGCVLSRAAASLMTDAVQGKSAAAALELGRELEAFVGSPPAAGAADRLGDLAVLEGVREFPSRIGCVTLPWQALARALAVTAT